MGGSGAACGRRSVGGCGDRPATLLPPASALLATLCYRKWSSRRRANERCCGRPRRDCTRDGRRRARIAHAAATCTPPSTVAPAWGSDEPPYHLPPGSAYWRLHVVMGRGAPSMNHERFAIVCRLICRLCDRGAVTCVWTVCERSVGWVSHVACPWPWQMSNPATADEAGAAYSRVFSRLRGRGRCRCSVCYGIRSRCISKNKRNASAFRRESGAYWPRVCIGILRLKIVGERADTGVLM